MYFEEAFEKIKTSLGKAKIDAGENHYAVQVRITDFDCGGTFYIEQRDGEFYIEPYNYFDFDTDIEGAFKDIKAIADGKADIKKAMEDGKIIITGNFDAFNFYVSQLKKPKKAPVKKVATKKTAEKKPAEKKAAPKKAAPKNAAPKKAATKKATK